MTQLLDTNIDLGKAENFDKLVGNGFFPVEVDDAQRVEFLSVLKEGVKLLEKINKDGAHEHDYIRVYSDTSQLHPTNPTKSDLINEDYYDPANPVAYLKALYSIEHAFKVNLSSFNNLEVEITDINCIGERFVANDTMMNDKCLSDVIYAAFMIFWRIYSPNAYDMPFVIDFLLNAIKANEPYRKDDGLTSSFEKALIQDMMITDSQLTFSNFYTNIDPHEEVLPM